MSFQTKSILARLLAEENLSVILDGKASTASFDLKSRTIAIPNWDDLSPELYDLLMGHEVGHARFTPLEGFHSSVSENKALKGYLNVCEDARIEKKMRRLYPGLRRSFLKGYAILLERDLFEINGKSLRDLLLIDRINIKTKFRTLVDVPFLNDEERALLAETEASETWDDVVAVAKKLYAYCKKENEQRKEEKKAQTDDDDSMDDDQEESIESSDESEDESENEYEDEDSDGSADSDEDLTEDSEESTELEEDSEEPVCQTDEAYRRNESTLAVNGEVVTLTLPKNIMENMIPVGEFISKMRFINKGQVPTSLYTTFIESNRNAIDQYVKEFRMRQSAAVWKKARVADTGDIDANRLAQYHMTDQIFKSRMVLPAGKNHGMLMLLDMSQSMAGEFEAAITQTLVLASFCQKVNIPFRVYGFTSNQRNSTAPEYLAKFNNNEMLIDGKVIELLRSDLRTNVYREAMTWLLGYAYAVKNMYNVHKMNLLIPGSLAMGNTPTSTAMAVMSHIIPEFKAKHNIERLSLITVTDGDDDGVAMYRTTDEYGVPSVAYIYPAQSGATYRLRIYNKLYSITPKQRYSRTTLVPFLNSIFKEHFGVETYGFWVLGAVRGSRTKHSLMGVCRNKDGSGTDVKETIRTLREKGYVESYYQNFTRFFVMSLNKAEDIQISKGWTTSKITKAFATKNYNKRLMRLIATKFMELAA